jgi:hypothetical protein
MGWGNGLQRFVTEALIHIIHGIDLLKFLHGIVDMGM